MKFDYLIWNKHKVGDPVFGVKTLLRIPRGFRVRIHKFFKADDEGCFHSHPAWAFRLILWGGYIEELPGGKFKTWFPGRFGIVAPHTVHRIAGLLNDESANPCSYSLWIRGPIIRDVHTTGC